MLYLRTENEIEKDKKEEVNNKLDNENFERENENFIERKGINIYQNENIFNKIIEENEVLKSEINKLIDENIYLKKEQEKNKKDIKKIY